MSVGIVDKQKGDRIPTAGMPAIDDALDLTSVNPVQNAIVTAALALKQDKTDNNLETTSKTVVGAINELKSGLTNLDVALSVPDGSGKNLIPLSLANFKTYSTDGTWASNVYSVNGIDFTVNTDASGVVTSISASGTASATAMIELRMDVKNGAYTLNGCPSGGSAGYFLQIYKSGVIDVKDRGDGAAVNLASDANVRVGLAVGEGLEVTDLTFYPMLRDARISDPTFAPYIPSVESRIESVEIARPVDTIDIPIVVSDDNVGTLYLRKLSNGFIYMRINAQTFPSTETVLTEIIPQQFRPYFINYIVGFSYGDKHRNARLDDSGTIILYAQKDSDSGFYCSCYYT